MKSSGAWVYAAHPCDLPEGDEVADKTIGSVWQCECGQYWRFNGKKVWTTSTDMDALLAARSIFVAEGGKW